MYRTRTRSYFHDEEFSWKQISINAWWPVPREQENACVRIIVSFLEAFSWSFTSPRYNTIPWGILLRTELAFILPTWNFKKCRVSFQCWWFNVCQSCDWLKIMLLIKYTCVIYHTFDLAPDIRILVSSPTSIVARQRTYRRSLVIIPNALTSSTDDIFIVAPPFTARCSLW